jgi:hypothetical protein
MMANVGGRYASLDILHAEPDLSATLLANLKAYSRRGDRSVGERLGVGSARAL